MSRSCLDRGIGKTANISCDPVGSWTGSVHQNTQTVLTKRILALVVAVLLYFHLVLKKLVPQKKRMSEQYPEA
jgi:hypothetical protein